MTGIAAVLLATATSGLSLQLAPERSEILVGEPLRLTLTWRAERTVRVPNEVFAGGWSYDYLEIWVNGPTGRHKYREIPAMLGGTLVVGGPLHAGDEFVSDLILLHGFHAMEAAMEAEGYLFQVPGTYTLIVRFADSENPADSNAIRVSVSEPKGDDRVVFDALKSNPNEIKLGGPAGWRLLAKNPRSPYLLQARISQYSEKSARLRDHRDPETGDPLSMSADEWDLLARETYRRMAEEIREEDDWGAYEDVRLATLAVFANLGGDKEEAARAKHEVLTRFPKSQAARVIRSDEARANRAEGDGDARPWSGRGVSYEVGDLVTHEGVIWRCIQAHRSEAKKSPPSTPTLWVKVPDNE